MTRSVYTRSAAALLLVPILLMSACAPKAHSGTEKNVDEAAQTDPLEGFNRVIFKINEGLDHLILKPVATIYKNVVPAVVRKSVTNALNNAWQPITFLNSVLQADAKNAGQSFGSFVVNTTVGIGGLFDVAGEVGLHSRREDFGQTLGKWGMGSGPYVVLPIIGPSTTRDSIGRAGDTLSNPITWIGGDYEWVKYATFGAYVIDSRTSNLDTIDNIYKTSLDPYATIRSLYLQHRQAQIENRE